MVVFRSFFGRFNLPVTCQSTLFYLLILNIYLIFIYLTYVI